MHLTSQLTIQGPCIIHVPFPVPVRRRGTCAREAHMQGSWQLYYLVTKRGVCGCYCYPLRDLL